MGLESQKSEREWRVCGRDFDPAQRTLARGSERETLSPPVSRLLHLMLQHADRTLEREWLLEQAWGGADVSDESLSKAISRLRCVLDDENHDAIETVHGVGYILRGSATAPEDEEHEVEIPPPARFMSYRAVIPAAVALLAMAIFTGGFFQTDGIRPVMKEGQSDFRMVGPTNLTFRSGRETTPQISPDGTRFAYIRLGEKHELVVSDVADPAGGQSVADGVFSARWSPDGLRIAYLGIGNDSHYEIFVVDADGSNMRRVGNTRIAGSLEWTPDQQALLFADSQATRSINLFSLALDGNGEQTPLFELTDPITRLDPRISPDGRYLSFREGVFPDSRLVVTGYPTEYTEIFRSAPGQGVRSHDWSPGSDALYVSMTRGHKTGIWRIDLERSPHRSQLVLETPSLSYLSVSRDSGAVAYAVEKIGTRISLFESASHGYEEVTAIASSEMDIRAVLSPSGERIAFLSNRTGDWAVWLKKAMDSEARPLFLPGDALQVTPAWSGDGERLMVAFDNDGVTALANIEVASGEHEVLDVPTDSFIKALAMAGEAATPVVSVDVDGRDKRVLKHNGSNWEIISTVDAVRLEVDLDSGQVFAAEASGYGLWAINLDGSGQRRVDVPIYPLNVRRWSLINQGLVFSRTDERGTTLERWRWAGDGAEPVTEQLVDYGGYRSHLSASWDGKVVSLNVQSSDEENVQLLTPESGSMLARR